MGVASSQDQRIKVVEKMLEFTELQKQPMDEVELEQKLKAYVLDTFQPTSQRVSEL